MGTDGRFEKIESDGIVVGVTKKDKNENRFAHLEVGGADEEKKDAPDGKKYFPCPKCGRNNKTGNLYCIYCGEIFPDVAEKTNSSLQPYELKCPGCGKTGNINQKLCIWCGYRFVQTDADRLREGRPVQVEINGVKYLSTDPYLPQYVKDAMLKIKRREMTPENAEKIFKGLQTGRAETRFTLLGQIEKNRYRAVSYGILAAGGILTFAGLLFMMGRHAGPAALFLLTGFGVVITGFLRFASVPPADEDNPMRRR